jgi:2',3'-cyclic-nucleotide 2'-phosphodiesterase (5'-nucleotidase family)
VDQIVLVSHLGFSQDMKLLSEVTGIDVCVSGHTHNRLYKPAVHWIGSEKMDASQLELMKHAGVQVWKFMNRTGIS